MISTGICLEASFFTMGLVLSQCPKWVATRLFTFALLAIFIACSGLFGLALFTAEQKTKEIGVRKVLGSSITGIITLLTKEYIKWILVANVIGLPVAYFAMKNWLDNFAYRIDLADYFWIFILACALSVIIAIVTVMYQSIKAALANQIEALKYE